MLESKGLGLANNAFHVSPHVLTAVKYNSLLP